MSILVYSDAGRHAEAAQLSCIAGRLVGEFGKGSYSHPLECSSQKLQRPIRSVGAAETLACEETIDGGKVLARSVGFCLGIDVELTVVLDSKDLFDCLYKQRSNFDMFIRAGLRAIRHEIEMSSVRRFIWILSRENLAEPGSKSNSPLADALRLLMTTARLPLSFSAAASRFVDRARR